MLLNAVTTPVRASVQTGEPPNLAREGDPIGLTAEAGGFARPNHGLTTVVTGHGLRYPVEISENSLKLVIFHHSPTRRTPKWQAPGDEPAKRYGSRPVASR